MNFIGEMAQRYNIARETFIDHLRTAIQEGTEGGEGFDYMKDEAARQRKEGEAHMSGGSIERKQCSMVEPWSVVKSCTVEACWCTITE